MLTIGLIALVLFARGLFGGALRFANLGQFFDALQNFFSRSRRHTFGNAVPPLLGRRRIRLQRLLQQLLLFVRPRSRRGSGRRVGCEVGRRIESLGRRRDLHGRRDYFQLSERIVVCFLLQSRICAARKDNKELERKSLIVVQCR